MPPSLRVCALLLFAACSPVTPGHDAGAPDGGSSDAGSTDAGSSDAGNSDGGNPDAGVPDGGWQSLFDGVSLTGWTKYLGIPSDGGTPLGVDNDPRGVFSVATIDGEPAIHISGEVWGALVSAQEYGAFDLHAEYKWGTNHHGLIDSGLMYLTTGPYGAVNAGGDALSNPIGSGAFQVSMEYQVAPGDVGSVYNLGPIQHARGGRSAVAELTGWNVIDLEVRTSSAAHFLNGAAVQSATGFELAWPGQPVVTHTRGRLQLQSEGGDIYFRRIRILPLN